MQHMRLFPELHIEHEGMKRCCKCKLWKPKDQFWKNKSARDGLQFRCRDCHQPAVKESAARRRAANPHPPAEKRCRQCGEVKPAGEFYRNGASGDWLSIDCRSCASFNYQEARRKDPSRVRAYSFKRYGDGAAEHYERLYAEQLGQCAICGRLAPILDIDHCHTTTELRSLLCGGCNRGLGCFDDDPQLLARAIEYLRWWGQPQADSDFFRPPSEVLRRGTRGNCNRTGIWQSLCCGTEATATKNHPFPYCPSCNKPAEWTYVRQKPKTSRGPQRGSRRVR
jgi:hypothetical protein